MDEVEGQQLLPFFCLSMWGYSEEPTLGGNIVECKTVRMVWNSGWRVRSFGTKIREPETGWNSRPAAQQASASLESAAVWFWVCVCVCVRMCARVRVFACTSWEAQWAGADAPSSHSNSPSRLCYLCLSKAFLLASSFSLFPSHLAFQPLILWYIYIYIYIYILYIQLIMLYLYYNFHFNCRLLLFFLSTKIILSFLSGGCGAEMWPYVFSNALLYCARYDKLESIDLIRENVDHIAVILHHILCGNWCFFAVACTLIFEKHKFHAMLCRTHLYFPWILTAEGYALTHDNMAALPSRAKLWWSLPLYERCWHHSDLIGSTCVVMRLTRDKVLFLKVQHSVIVKLLCITGTVWTFHLYCFVLSFR